MDIASGVSSGVRLQDGRKQGGHLVSHLMDLLLNAFVILIGLFLYGWLSTNTSSPLAGKI